MPDGNERNTAGRSDQIRKQLSRFCREEEDFSRERVTELLEAAGGLLADLERDRDELRRRVQWLRESQSSLDRRLLRVEHSRLFRALRFAGTIARDWRGRAGRWLYNSPFHPAYARLAPARRRGDDYRLWAEDEQARTPSAEWHRRRALEFSRRPLFSVLMPVHNARRDWLEAAVNSVLEQSYSWWELCACDDGSGSAWIGEYFSSLAAKDSRVRFVAAPARGGISEALNRAADLAGGEYIGLLDQDDLLSPHALHYAAEALDRGEADLLYSDEDLIGPDGRPVCPVFKPSWSPDLLTACMYMGHFLVVSRAALERAGPFRSAFDFSQDYDLALRVCDRPVPVRHVPRILYHWRQHENSTAGNPAAKPQAHAAGRGALEDAVRRRAIDARVEDGPSPGTYRLRRKVCGEPLASIVVCSRNPKLLSRCVRAIGRMTGYPHRELVLVQHGPGDWTAVEGALRGVRSVAVPYNAGFNFSRMNNQAVRVARGEVLVFLNDDVEPLAREWLDALIAQAQRPEVGPAGARLLYPSGAVQHAGMVIGIVDGAGHPGRGRFGTPNWNWGGLTRNVSAVTGACLAVRKSVFEELDGFDEKFPVNYNDIDFCLRAREKGYEVIYEASAVLRHREASTRRPMTHFRERERLQERWGPQLSRGDPFYNANLSRTTEDASLATEIDWAESTDPDAPEHGDSRRC